MKYATLEEILNNANKFKICSHCEKICSISETFCDCGSKSFRRKGVKIAVENEIEAVMRIYNYSRKEALETQIDI